MTGSANSCVISSSRDRITEAAAALSGRDGSLLDTIRLWRERGIVPDALKASRCVQNDGQTKLEFERYIYPYGSDRFKPEQISPACCERYLR